MLKGLSGGGGATAGQIPGVSSGTTIGAGFIGEFISAASTSGAPLNLATTVYQNIGGTSIAPGAGNWMIEMQISFVLAAATVTLLQVGISQTSITLPPPDGTGIMQGNSAGPIGQNVLALVAATGTHTITVPPVYCQCTGGAIYGVVGATFSAGAITCYGTIKGWRFS